MTPKQILDSFSSTLMQDDRILSHQEQSLLSNLLHHARAATAEDQATHAAVQRVISSAVGETVAQRAFSILGANIVEKIVEGGSDSAEASASQDRGVAARQPQPPGQQPQPPGSDRPQPQPPGQQPQPPGLSGSHELPRPTARQPQPPGNQPQPPSTGNPPSQQPQPPGRNSHIVVEAGVALADPALSPAKSVVLDEFLAPQELEELMKFTLEHESEFQTSEVVSPTSEKGVVNHEHRRSKLLMDLGPHQDVILARIKSVLPAVLEKLEMQEFSIAGVEVQITASNHGDFFRFHNDNGSDQVARRHVTFVYFFHREPCSFRGGELRIHDARRDGETYLSEGSFQTIVPRQNQIVFFPCELMHEVTAIRCPSGMFADSRFTLNGWLRR
jgi:Rps23 Pro-64 3,4-dihydroxylase Tpa1-like proline 4-hydroxylase